MGFLSWFVITSVTSGIGLIFHVSPSATGIFIYKNTTHSRPLYINLPDECHALSLLISFCSIGTNAFCFAIISLFYHFLLFHEVLVVS